MVKQFVCYLLSDDDLRKTYIGYTCYDDTKHNGPTRRLRQHNGEIKGGARATKHFQGCARIVGYVSGFLHKKDARSFEATWKKSKPRAVGVRKRIKRAFELCMMEKWSKNSIPIRHMSRVDRPLMFHLSILNPFELPLPTLCEGIPT